MLLHRVGLSGEIYSYEVIGFDSPLVKLRNRYGGESQSDIAKAVASGYVLRYLREEGIPLEWPGKAEMVRDPQEAFLTVPQEFLSGFSEPESVVDHPAVLSEVIRSAAMAQEGREPYLTIVDIGPTPGVADLVRHRLPEDSGDTEPGRTERPESSKSKEAVNPASGIEDSFLDSLFF